MKKLWEDFGWWINQSDAYQVIANIPAEAICAIATMKEGFFLLALIMV
jgi:hypothetical protein